MNEAGTNGASVEATEAIKALDQIWQQFVPRSSRPANKGLYDRIKSQLILAQQHAHQNSDEADADADGEDDEDESPLASVMQIVRTLSPEQWEQVQILMRMRRLSDVGRAELFYELGESHHTDCGMELFDPDDPHDVCPAAEEGDENDDAAKPAVPLLNEPSSS